MNTFEKFAHFHDWLRKDIYIDFQVTKVKSVSFTDAAGYNLYGKKGKSRYIFHNVVLEMQLFGHFKCFRYLRMTLPTFEKLLGFVAPEITKIKSNFREPFLLRWSWLLVCGF